MSGLEVNDSELADLLAQMTQRTGVAHAEGTLADSEHVSEDRAIWIADDPKLGGWTAAPIRLQPADGHGVAEHRESYAIALYAPTRAALRRRYHQLIAGLENVLSWTAFEVGKALAAPRGGGVDQIGWGILVPVTLKGPVYDLVFGVGTVTSTSLGVTTEKRTGEGGEALDLGGS